MDTTYKYNEMSAYKLAVQLEQMLKKESSCKGMEWRQRITEIEQRIQMKKFRIAVVGEFNRGKSSFINVLLGKRILPEDILPTTATINRVTYGEVPKAYLIMKNTGEKSQEIPVEELTSYVTKLTESSAKAASEIYEAVVEYPTMLCFNDVDLIDTPGMNDMDDMNAVTVNRLEDIDLAIVAINAQYPYSETENRFVVKLLESKKICQIIFVVTHFDMIRDKDKKKLYDFFHARIHDDVLEALKKNHSPDDKIFQKYHSIFDDLHIYGVSSLLAMDALETNNMELYAKSGFLQLTKELPQLILSSRSVNMIDNIFTLIEEIIDEYKKEKCKYREELTAFEKVKPYYSNLFDMELQGLEEIALNEVSTDAIQQDAEQQNQRIVKNLLLSLGNIKEMTFDSIHQAMLPVMQEEFKHINFVYQSRKIQILEMIINQKWSSSLSRFVSEMNDKLKMFPTMFEQIQKEYKDFSELPNKMIIKSDGSSELSVDEYTFCWIASPIQVVLDTEENQSVLPGLQTIVKESIQECVIRTEDKLKKDISEMLLLIKKEMESLLASVDSGISKMRQQIEENAAILTDIDVLQKQCSELHKSIL